MGWGAALGSALSIGSTILGGKSESDTASFNEEQMKKEAAYQKKRGKMEAERRMEDAKRVIAKGELAFAKSGVRLASASVSDVFEESMSEGLYDAAMIRMAGENAALGALTTARQYGEQADVAIQTGLLQAAETALTTDWDF